jgi:hypothetical protein
MGFLESNHDDVVPADEAARLTEEIQRENEGFLINSYDILPKEKQVQLVQERWQKERARAMNKVGGTWFDFTDLGHDLTRGFNTGTYVGNLAKKIAEYVARRGADGLESIGRFAAGESAQQNTQIIEGVREQQRTFSAHQDMLNRYAHERIPFIKQQAREQIHISEAVPPEGDPAERSRTHLNPEQEVPISDTFYQETDTVTLEQGELGEQEKARCVEYAQDLIAQGETESTEFTVEDPELEAAIKNFYGYAAELATKGDADAALRYLDYNLGGGPYSVWQDNARKIAVSMGDLKRKQIGQQPVTFEDVSYVMSKNASGFMDMYMERGEEQDREESGKLLAMLARTNEPGQTGVQALDDLLEYAEHLLSFRTEMLNRKLIQSKLEGGAQPAQDNEEFGALYWRNELEEAQRMRDAVYKEREQRKQRMESDRAEYLIPDTTSSPAPDATTGWSGAEAPVLNTENSKEQRAHDVILEHSKQYDRESSCVTQLARLARELPNFAESDPMVVQNLFIEELARLCKCESDEVEQVLGKYTTLDEQAEALNVAAGERYAFDTLRQAQLAVRGIGEIETQALIESRLHDRYGVERIVLSKATDQASLRKLNVDIVSTEHTDDLALDGTISKVHSQGYELPRYMLKNSDGKEIDEIIKDVGARARVSVYKYAA